MIKVANLIKILDVIIRYMQIKNDFNFHNVKKYGFSSFYTLIDIGLLFRCYSFFIL
jgi:hypothetical protein